MPKNMPLTAHGVAGLAEVPHVGHRPYPQLAEPRSHKLKQTNKQTIVAFASDLVPAVSYLGKGDSGQPPHPHTHTLKSCVP